MKTKQTEQGMDFFSDLQASVANALREDIGDGDITAELINPQETAVAKVIAREPAVICGRPWVDEVFRQTDPAIKLAWQVDEGARVAADTLLFTAAGQARALLSAERTSLNFLQLLSGTATCTRDYVEQVAHTDVQLLDTRKTIPGLRLAQKYAVATGGAANHRLGLFDAYLIKENHIQAAGSISGAIDKARSTGNKLRVEVEVESLAELDEALAANPDWIMLDNLSLADLQTAVSRTKGTDIKLEASGGIDSAKALRAIAETGVDYISMGALTKQPRAIDLSMRFSKA